MKDPKPSEAPDKRPQIEKFRELAKRVGADGSDEPLKDALKRVAAVKKAKEGRKWRTTFFERQDDGTLSVIKVEEADRPL